MGRTGQEARSTTPSLKGADPNLLQFGYLTYILLFPTSEKLLMESIMLSEISQTVEDKYHMISPTSGT